MANTVKARFQLKYDTEENWNKAGPKQNKPGFIPLKGELIIYSVDDAHPFSRLKVGDGTTPITDLPFVTGNNTNSNIEYGTTNFWNEKRNYVPKEGTIVIYSDKSTIQKDNQQYYQSSFKIGDGNTYLVDLPFFDDYTITNTGVTSVSQGTTNGTINVTTNGSTSAVAIQGLGSAAYTASTAYATAAQGEKADAAMSKSGGTFTGAVTLHSDPTTNLMAATKQYVDNNVLEFIISTNSSNSSTLTGVTTTALADGKMIVYCLAYTLTGDPVTLTLFNTLGTSLGNYPIYIDGTTQCSSVYRAGTMLFLVFYNNKFTIINPFGLIG